MNKIRVGDIVRYDAKLYQVQEITTLNNSRGDSREMAIIDEINGIANRMIEVTELKVDVIKTMQYMRHLGDQWDE